MLNRYDALLVGFPLMRQRQVFVVHGFKQRLRQRLQIRHHLRRDAQRRLVLQQLLHYNQSVKYKPQYEWK